jgi:hypothetical protein
MKLVQTKIKYPQITQISILGSDAAQGYRKRDRARKMFFTEESNPSPLRNLRNLCNLRIFKLHLGMPYSCPFACIRGRFYLRKSVSICGWSVFFACIRGLHLL